MSEIKESPFELLKNDLESRVCYNSNLEGRLLTFVEATFSDKTQREAVKSFIRQIVRDHYNDCNFQIEYTLNCFTDQLEGQTIVYSPIKGWDKTQDYRKELASGNPMVAANFNFNK